MKFYFNSDLKIKLLQALDNAEYEIHNLANNTCNDTLQAYSSDKVWFNCEKPKKNGKLWYSCAIAKGLTNLRMLRVFFSRRNFLYAKNIGEVS